MISFDTFSGPRARVREAELDASGLLVFAEQAEPPAPVLFPPPPDPLDSGREDQDDADASSSSDEADDFYESQDEDCSLFHEHSPRLDGGADVAGERGTSEIRREQPEPEVEAEAEELQTSSGGRIRQLVKLLTLKSHNVGDARSALVRKLLGVVSVNELLLSKATEEQIANAANDAITDEILASVDQEERRRSSLAQQLVPAASSSALALPSRFPPGPLSPFRVLELVDVLDSSTGGMVKHVLTKVRRGAPFGARMVRHNAADKDVEFCRFCAAYGDHTAAQHRCRLCGVAGHHRSRSCPHSTALTITSTSTASNSNSAVNNGGDGPRFCTLCNSWGLHATERHRCRTCGTHGAHRSQSCPLTSSAASSSSRVPWIGSPAESLRERKHCSHCNAWRPHASDEHRCRLCGSVGDHGSKNCPKRLEVDTSDSYEKHADDTSPARSPEKNATRFCSFCRKEAAHSSSAHLCRVCHAVGAHRSDACPLRPSGNTVLSYSVDAASKMRDRVLEKIPLVLPPPAAALVWRSLDKVGDADLILRRTLQRIGVWGGGSQTPITTPYAPPSVGSGGTDGLVSPGANGQDTEALQLLQRHHPELVSPPRGVGSASSSSSGSSGPLLLDEGRASGVYVLSYAEGHSVVPARILKYMRLLMHHEVSTNAFSVVVRFDPRPSHWELQKPGMVSPRSLPSSPTMSRQMRKRMAHYTLQTLRGARDKLRQLVAARRKLEQRLRLQEQLETHPQEGDEEPEKEQQTHAEEDERQQMVFVDA
ncbi:hypothetical protein BBJ28_00017431 [Nothophytophthora sp. Chile5]|nr:hypothetical protein BBJ28_00017431 [Nothophytophthora sp. Chile5]